MKAVFLDKDGVLVEDVPYNADPEKIKLTPFAGRSLNKLQQQGFRFIIVSNQSGIARGYFKKEDLHGVWNKIQSLLKDYDVSIDAFYYCPHLTGCNCRKPSPALIKKAALDLKVDLLGSWMIGDVLDDIEAGNLAGCQTILLDSGNETEWVMSENRMPLYIVQNLLQAASYIGGHING